MKKNISPRPRELQFVEPNLVSVDWWTHLASGNCLKGSVMVFMGSCQKKKSVKSNHIPKTVGRKKGMRVCLLSRIGGMRWWFVLGSNEERSWSPTSRRGRGRRQGFGKMEVEWAAHFFRALSLSLCLVSYLFYEFNSMATIARSIAFSLKERTDKIFGRCRVDIILIRIHWQQNYNFLMNS